jgi:uncharacterized membrane protein
VITLASTIAFLAAVVLFLEKLRLIDDPTYVPTCSINPVLSCGSIMKSNQAEAFGFPNPVLGLAGFGLFAVFGVRLVLGFRPSRSTWLLAQAGATFAFVFVCWLIFQSLYRIEALCPYCMVVWLATFVLFWYLTLANLDSGRITVPAFMAPALDLATRLHFTFLTAAVLIVIALIGEAFWDYWSTLI